MENFVNKLQDEMNVVDKEYLRKIQGTMYKCSAKCCDEVMGTQVELQQCIEKCSFPVQKADRYVQEEMQNLQDRFQRCAMSCADKVRDKSDNAQDQARMRPELEACVGKCGDEMITLLPGLTKRMKDWFKNGSYNY